MAVGSSFSARDDAQEFVSTLRERWKVIVVSMLVLTTIAVTYLHITKFEYEVTLVVTASQASEQAPGSQLGGAFSSLLGRASVGQQATPFDLYLAELRSHKTAAALSGDARIMTTAFAKEWNAAASRWQPSEGLVSRGALFAMRLLGLPVTTWAPPGANELQAYLQKQVQIQPAADSPFVSIVFYTPDPKFGVYLLDKLNGTTDRTLRKRALRESKSYVNFLLQEIDKARYTEHRQAVAAALVEQQRTEMIARSPLHYAARVVSGPTVSLNPKKPNALLILIAAPFFGLLLALAVLLTARILGPLPSRLPTAADAVGSRRSESPRRENDQGPRDGPVA